jgi:HEAT repeat protein
LGEAIGDAEPVVRAAALRALHDIGDLMPFIPPESVTRALEDDSPQVRYWAAGALGHAGRGIDPSVPALLRHAEHDADAEVRSVCAHELQDYIKPPAVTPALVPLLTEALKSPERRVRSAACAMLGRFGPASVPAISSIIDVLKRRDGKPGSQDEAVSRLDEQSQAATALSKLAPGTPHADQAARAIVEALQAVPAKSQVATIPLINALAPFGRLAQGSMPRLRELEQGSNEAVRDSARKALAIIDPSQ